MKKSIFILLWLVFPFILLSQDDKIRFITDSGSHYYGKLIFDIHGDVNFQIDEENVPVYVGNHQNKPANKPKILGTYEKVESIIVFTPRFPFTQGKSYTAFILDQNIRKTFEVPRIKSPSPNKIAKFYPSSDEVPANLLKFYIEFENPMRHGQAYQNILLIKDSKDTIEAPFLEFEQELWNKEQKLLTVWLDPGRIKRDLSPNQLLGNPLEANSKYELIIRKTWKDIYGQSLPKDFVKHFSVKDFDRKKPDESSWKINYPSIDTKEALSIQFQQSLDYGTLLNGFQIEKGGKLVETELIIDDFEKSVQLKPKSEWKPGKYQLYINTNLEDLAGNNLNRLFDTDLSQKNSEEKGKEEIMVEFLVE